MIPSVIGTETRNSHKLLKGALWVAQGLIFASFCFFGFTKLTTPISQLAGMMPWTGAVPASFVRLMGLIDIVGGIGIFMPALTRIRPRLTVAAAFGCTALQICASAFHISRGEFAVLPLNVVLLALCLFILWGRTQRFPILSRTDQP
ncbi:DoxX family protein [Rhizobium tumorigenes]|uniref:DoxX family protein n=1 Tax=Rhizobium tumorigenes TaxID=2041385 RepID=A0AAF1KX50_9HYPH|nr:DoxX family protein [Rhizobium tumorigenes]WFR99249.1 DoxX family protein [Rhizobium tumorigenes]